MKCEICGRNEAKYEFIEVVNGKIYKKHVCGKCLSQIESGIVKPDYSKIKIFQQERTECPVCKTTMEEILTKNKFGCPNCYFVFKNFAEEVIYAFHGSLEYKGKNYIPSLEKKKLWDEIKNLKMELKKALEAEDYEKAAKLRDEIKNKEKNLWM